MAKALVVSGDDNSRYLYETAVAFQKIEVSTAKTIKEAVQMILKDFPDIVVLDLETVPLTEMSAFNEVKKKKKTLPMIIMTDLREDEAKKQACVLGTCHILAQKKATLGNLIKKIRQEVR